VGLLAVTGQAWAQSSKHHTSKSANKTESYMVVEVKGEYRVISSSAMKDETKRLDEDYKKAIALWEDENQAGAQKPKPIKPKVIVKKRGFKTHEGADEYLRALKEKDQGEGKDGKDNPKSDGKKVEF
jgi:hypothetical protein